MPGTRKGRQAKTAGDLARRGPTRNALKRFLIVCEGSKTEPQYFRALARDLRLSTADVIVCGEECGTDPLSVVNYAHERFREDKDIDHVYCVIDKDSHTNLAAAVEFARSIRMPEDKTFRMIISVPCFEFWVLLHVEYSTAPYTRSAARSPCQAVIERIKNEHFDSYQKGNEKIFEVLKDRLPEALTRASRAVQAASDNGTDNPSTEIHILVTHLIEAVRPSAA